MIAKHCDQRKEALARSFPRQDANAALAYDGWICNLCTKMAR